MKRNYLPIIGPLAILLIVGLACKTPFSQPEDDIPAEEASAAEVEESAVVEEPAEEIVIQVSPGLIEIDPVSGSTIAFNQSFILYFNQPMKENMVLDHIQIEPQAGMKHDWLDESTLEITLIEPIPLNDTLTITIEEGIQAQ